MGQAKQVPVSRNRPDVNAPHYNMYAKMLEYPESLYRVISVQADRT